jgi:hypothetical protein
LPLAFVRVVGLCEVGFVLAIIGAIGRRRGAFEVGCCSRSSLLIIGAVESSESFAPPFRQPPEHAPSTATELRPVRSRCG